MRQRTAAQNPIPMKSSSSLIAVAFAVSATSCQNFQEMEEKRSLLGNSESDQSTVWDSNGDGLPDVERWYRGSGVVYEKLDTDFDGYWDMQGQRKRSGSFVPDTEIRYPSRKYSTARHHVFYKKDGESLAVMKEITARKGAFLRR